MYVLLCIHLHSFAANNLLLLHHSSNLFYPLILSQAFTRVFGPDCTQGDVFLQAAHPLFERFVGGDSSVLLAYGMTNAGKTHTIQGSKENPGVMPLLVQEVLQHMAGGDDWDLNISMLEIYQEKIFDLLSEKKKKEKLNIRDGNGRVEVMGLSQHPISSSDQAIDLMDAAMSRRSNSKTHLNNGSSRSHAVYGLTLSRYIGGREIKSEFQVVDLAGAERGKRTQGTTSQQREANNINMSLMQLWRCLQAMGRSGKSASDIVPFRESKLTHLLMPLLGRVGLCGVSMVTCVNPQNDDYDETVSILGNASIACKIQEISDLGRTVTVGVVGLQSERSNPLDNIRSHKQRNSSTSSSGSAVGHAKHSKGGGQRNSSMMSVPETDNATGSALKKLKEEVGLMRTQNEQLLQEQAMREQEIREEVAEEMAERSAHLLEQIQELQEQVNSTTNNFYNDVTKSVMKAKKRQLQVANEEISAELQESVREMETELAQVRETYEDEIEMLKREKDDLEQALDDWKTKAEEAIAIAETLNDEKEHLQRQLLEVACERSPVGVIVAQKAPAAPPAPVNIFDGINAAAEEEREWFETDNIASSAVVTSQSSSSTMPENMHAEGANDSDDNEDDEEGGNTDVQNDGEDDDDMPPAYDDATHVEEESSAVQPPAAPEDVSSTGKRGLLEGSASAVSESISVIIPPTRLSRTIGSSGEVLDDVDSCQSTHSQPALRASAASAFEMRMKRDQRFQKTVVPEAIKEGNSPVRSPLAPACANSPKNKASVTVFNENSKAVEMKAKSAVAGSKRALSPTRSHASAAAIAHAQDAKENMSGTSLSHMPTKSPARKRTREEPIVKMTAKQTARAAEQKAKQKAIDLQGTAIAPPINPARRLRSRAV